jgi:hypothetical protein
MPGTVISSWLGQERQNSRAWPIKIDPGSAAMNSFGMEDAASNLP